MTTTLRPFKLFVVCSNYLLRHTLHGCGSLRPFKLFVVRSNYLQKEHCDSREASTHSNDLRHAQIICCRSHCTAAESLFVQIICKALTLFEAAPPCVSNRALRVLRSVLRYAFIVLRVPPPPCVGTCVGMRSLVLRSPAPGRVLGGVMQRETRCFCPPHMTRKTQKERAAASAPHTFRSRNAETQKRGRRSSWYGRCQGGSAATACPVESATVTVVLRHGVGWSSWEQHGLSWARKLKAGRAAARTSAQLNSFGTRAAARDMTPAEGAGRYGERRD